MIDQESILERIRSAKANREARRIATREVYQDPLARGHSGLVRRVQEILSRRKHRYAEPGPKDMSW